jgi:hypothetical protein
MKFMSVANVVAVVLVLALGGWGHADEGKVTGGDVRKQAEETLDAAKKYALQQKGRVSAEGRAGTERTGDENRRVEGKGADRDRRVATRASREDEGLERSTGRSGEEAERAKIEHVPGVVGNARRSG